MKYRIRRHDRRCGHAWIVLDPGGLQIGTFRSWHTAITWASLAARRAA